MEEKNIENNIVEENTIEEIAKEKAESIKMVGKKDLLIVAIAFSFMMGIFAPLDLYFSNIGDLWFDVFDVGGIIIISSILMFLIVYLIGVVLNKKSKTYKIYILVMSVLTVCFYIQGTYIEVPYGTLNDEFIEWNAYFKYDFQSFIVWLGIIIACAGIAYMAGYKRFVSVSRVVMIWLIITQFISGLIAGNKVEGWNSKVRYYPNTDNVYNYSSTENYNILVLDTYDSRVLWDYMKDGREQLVADTFEDFTFYRDTLGTFNLTDYAVPHILSGQKYIGDRRYEQYIEEVYDGSRLINGLYDEDYIINMYYSHVPQGENRKKIANESLVNLEKNNSLELAGRLYQLVLFKYLPTPLKRFAYFPMYYFGFLKEGVFLDDETGARTLSNWENLGFAYNNYNMCVTTEDKMFHLFHLKGLHAIRDLDNNLEIIKDYENTYSLEGEAGVINAIVNDWLVKLKAAGVYDNSVIVIMSDHGASTYEDLENFTQCPLLLVKGRNEKHEFKISDAPISYDDLQDLFTNLLDGAVENQVIESVMKSEGIEMSNYEPYTISDIPRKELEIYSETPKGRRRFMIFHRFKGSLMGTINGGEGYELYTDCDSYNGHQIQATGVIY